MPAHSDVAPGVSTEPTEISNATSPDVLHEETHPPSQLREEDSAVTKAEKKERPGSDASTDWEPSAKRLKVDQGPQAPLTTSRERQKGVAPIKAEFLVHPPGSKEDRGSAIVDDDAAEAVRKTDGRDRDGSGPSRKKEKSRGQNKARDFGSSRDERGLCQSRTIYPEFSPAECRFGESCKFEHDLRTYLSKWKRPDLTTFDGKCPVWSLKGNCDVGWKCRFVGSHMREIEAPDGRKELVLTEKSNGGPNVSTSVDDVDGIDIFNVASTESKIAMTRRKFATPRADEYSDWLDKHGREMNQTSGRRERTSGVGSEDEGGDDGVALHENRALYREPPFLPSEKRRIYFGSETPVLAPLTTQGNLPFRRLCVDFGAQLTYSEMAMSLPLIQGQKSEWALMKVHRSEMKPPRYSPTSVVEEYDNSQDFKFGAQISAGKHLHGLKATETLTKICPFLRVIDLNCGCPIDLVYRQGAGSGLLDNQSKLDKMVRGMNAVSEKIPITVKIRTGTKDGKPNALKLVNRLVYGNPESGTFDQSSSGVAAITLHGRSRQQRYTRNADWGYISECAALVTQHKEDGADIVDTVRQTDSRYSPAAGKVFFIGNGDCYSYTDYNDHIMNANVDSVMVARGALIKPWIFEEIEKGQYLDKSARERLDIIERYVKYGLETWGSDEMGIGTTRRFLLEWLSFSYRYVPVGILEHLPPSLQDRPPAWRGRSDLETLLGSDNYKDWIKISEMFLGPAHSGFKFEPKHKSNSYEIDAEG